MTKRKRQNKKSNSKLILKNTFKFILFLLLLFILLIFMVSRLINQQKTLSQQDKDIKYYVIQKQQLEEENKELKSKTEKIDSKEYIENIAREKLNMYYPNEKLYLDASAAF